MGLTDFVSQLKELGYAVEELGADKVAFNYTIPSGRFKGQEIKLGFHVQPDLA